MSDWQKIGIFVGVAALIYFGMGSTAFLAYSVAALLFTRRCMQPTRTREKPKAAGEELCMCKDRALSECPGEWEQGCDLGANEKYARRAPDISREVDASLGIVRKNK